MLKQLSPIDLIAAVQKQVQEATNLRCYDFVDKGLKAPFYYVELIAKKPTASKTMYLEQIEVYIHAIAKADKSSVGIYQLIEKLQEAMTQDIKLPQGFNLYSQTSNGLITLQLDETNEKHAVNSYVFKVCYGFKCKV